MKRINIEGLVGREKQIKRKWISLGKPQKKVLLLMSGPLRGGGGKGPGH